MDASQFYPSKFLRAADISSSPMIITIDDVAVETMQDGAQKPVISFKETKKKLVSNKTNWNTIQKIFGRDTDEWLGKRIALVKAVVDFKGESVDTIRVRPAPARAETEPPVESQAELDDLPF